jgi:hypothetical protein
MLISECDREMPNTQKTLERVPADKWDWKPHDKAGSLVWMAGHVATLTGFTTVGIKTPALEIADANIPRVEEQADLLSTFAMMRQEASEALAGAADEQFHQTWTRMSRPRTSFRRDRC